jgi:hypothetical protein
MDKDHFVLSGAPVPLKDGERHCYYCGGYGHVPRPPQDSGPSRSKRCNECMGIGKVQE